VKLTCPSCRADIPLEDINVSTDIALCRRCNETYSFAELSSGGALRDVNTAVPPDGAWFESQGNDFEVGATSRSWTALILVPFTVLWSGVSLRSIYGSQFANGRFDPTASLFGTPFLLGSLVLIAMTLMAIFGKVVVRRSSDQGSVFIGVGPLGWTRRFRWSEIRAARHSLTKWHQNDSHLPIIELVGPTPIRFGSRLSDSRRAFMLAVLQRRVSGRG
jgi:hypothetical protein